MKTVLVTGGARGIGRAIVRELARDHAVAFTHLSTPPGAALGEAPGTMAIKADVTSDDLAQTVIKPVLRRFGRLDVIVNNAGALSPSPVEGFERAEIQAQFDVNVTAPAALLAAALPHLTAGASVVNISSINGRLPPKGAALYGASKAALDLWTRGMAKELGPKGIRVNAVAPGAINIPEEPRDGELTRLFEEMTAMGKLATPEDIAAAVRFLSSDAARMITGEILSVSGGYRL